MADAIFLSAGVPDPKRGPEFAKTANSVAIAAAVSALVHVTLGRRLLVWGGQPAITPMIKVVADGMSIDYGKWVRLYQSRFFEDQFPEDNDRFKNVIYTKEIKGDREKSLLEMRRRMFSEQEFKAAVFVGGMAGIIDEYKLFQKLQPNAAVIPIISTGGATLNVAEQLTNIEKDLVDDLDYVQVFHRHLGVSVREERYPTPESQPASIKQRYWKPNKAYRRIK